MAERDIDAEELYSFVTGKHSDLCCVRSCRNDRRACGGKLCTKHSMRLWRLRNPTKSTYGNIRNKAKQRRIFFALTFEHFKEICEATGYLQGKGQEYHSLSLDRIDPNKGYEDGNIQVLTLSENSSKGSYERWVTLKDGTRMRIYQVSAAVKESELEKVEEEEEIPSWLQHEIKLSEDEPF